VNVHLIDGTYELFRHFYAVPPRSDRAGREVGALLGVLHSLLGMLEAGVTHIGVATDHVIESFRNELWPGYKSSAGIDPALWAQFHPLEGALAAMGVAVWPMVELEADDGLASAARVAGADPAVERVFICTPDKDLSQCVSGTRIVQFDRRQRALRDEEGVVEKFGVRPASIPDYLALVGDSADGFPGIRGWGAKSTAAVLSHYGHLEAIPRRSLPWGVAVRGAARLQEKLRDGWQDALLFRDLATLRDDAPLFDDLEELRWIGATPGFERVADSLGDARLAARVSQLLSERDRGRV
jgi:5'-3' exonuclease